MRLIIKKEKVTKIYILGSITDQCFATIKKGKNQ